MNHFIRHLGDVSARRPWATIGVWAVVATLVVALAATLGGAFADDISAPGSESAEAIELLEERFPAAAGGSAVAVFAAEEGARLEDSRTAVSSALSQVAGIEHVAGVTDPFTTGRVSPDGRVGVAEITFDVPSTELGHEPVKALTLALEPARSVGLAAELGGEAAFFNAEAESSLAEAVGLLAALVILLVAFGTVVAALVPIGLALVAVGTGIAGITLLAGATDVSTAAPGIGALVGLGVGIDYALFVVARYRDNRTAGRTNAAALSDAMASSGTAVLFAGGTVVLAMAALVLTGVGFLASIGIATAVIVLFAVGTALSLLPAVLSLLGDRIDSGRLVSRHRAARPAEATAWWRLAHRIAGRPWPYLVVSSVLLLALAAPALSISTGFPDAGSNPTSTSERRAYDLLADGFGPGANSPLLVVADLRAAELDVAGIATDLAADPGVSAVGEPRVAENGDTAILPVLPTTEPADAATRRTVERIRALTPDGVSVTGPTALTLDLDEQLADSLPLFVGAILSVSFLLLMVVFRSVAVPLKAAVMNLLSIGGAYGVVVAVFQWGWLGGLFGLDETVLIASPFPTLFFAVLFGLSMDYEVFLVSRIREAYDATGDNTEAVARGMAATGRVITSGALIMIVVFLSFVANPSPFEKMIGLGLATAIFLDATLVRMVLVPATMSLMGRANWWLPGWLDRMLPHVSLDADRGLPAPEPVPVLAGGLTGQPCSTWASRRTVRRAEGQSKEATRTWSSWSV